MLRVYATVFRTTRYGRGGSGDTPAVLRMEIKACVRRSFLRFRFSILSVTPPLRVVGGGMGRGKDECEKSEPPKQ